jgi:O-Antigen ligase.
MVRSKNLYYYYGFLFVVNLVLGLRYHGEASTMMRLFFLFMVIVPTFQNVRLLPITISLFFISSTAGYVYGLMPSQLYWYAIITLIAVGSLTSNNKALGKVPVIMPLLFIYISFINIIKGMAIESISYSILIVIAFFMIQRYRDEWTLSFFSIVFALISLALSIMFVVASPSETHSYGYSGLERTMAFADPNYYACTLGMGAFACVMELFRKHKQSFAMRSFYAFVAIFSFVILVLNASRGGILAFALSAAVIIVFSRIKKVGKIVTILALVILVVFLYQNDYFALLEYRMANDTGGGSQRTAIWMYKLNVFFNESSLSQIIFGYGFNDGLAIGGRYFNYGSGKVLGFHNDFVAFLVDYGFIGFVLFLTFLGSLLSQGRKDKVNGLFCLSGLLFIFVHVMTLEPFSVGSLSMWVFFFYIYLIGQAKYNTKHESSLDSKRYIS